MKIMERETGIGPASLAWKARVLPLNYSRAVLPSALATYHLPNFTFRLKSRSIRAKPDLTTTPHS